MNNYKIQQQIQVARCANCAFWLENQQQRFDSKNEATAFIELEHSASGCDAPQLEMRIVEWTVQD